MRGRIAWGFAVLSATAVLPTTLGTGAAVAGRRPPRRPPVSAIRVSTGGARAITETSARVIGTVLPGGGRTQYYLAFGTTSAYGSRTPWTRLRATRRHVAAAARIAALAPSTTYHYRLVAARCGHCRPVYGADRVFTTAAVPVPPSVRTGPSSSVAQTTAALTGAVNPQRRATSYYFAYGPTPAYGRQTSPVHAGSGSAAVPVISVVGGLGAVTRYHYRIVARNRAGTTYGADETFTTGGYYENPVYSSESVPDPFVLDNNELHSDYWAFGTGSLFAVVSSPDLVHWTAQGTAMTTRPSWVVSSGSWHPWAPSVIQSDQACPGASSGGCYIMYYVGLSEQFDVNCIGVATSPTPGGPYIDQGPLGSADSLESTGSSATGPGMPVGCGDDAGEGNIDPSPFIDASGQAYLYVSTDRSCSVGSCGIQSTISVIPLANDRLQASGPRVALFAGDAGTWEAAGVRTPTVEGPFMELHNGTYYLFYSGGSWQAAYGMGYATAPNPTGPFTKSSANPILVQTPTVVGPGGGDALVTGPHGGSWLLYAARNSTANAPRTLRLDPFYWRPAVTADAPDVPVIAGPTSTLQPTQP
ncbi:MAG: family 43 glycosylhydrolase [Actinomycetota bacterium]|nr:family 43 glycosylhydrolase [Actinomycetota bacterium]